MQAPSSLSATPLANPGAAPTTATVSPAKPAATGTATTDRSTEFRAAGPEEEQYNGGTLLTVAYGLFFVILFAWLLMMWRSQRAMHKRADELDRAIDAASKVK